MVATDESPVRAGLRWLATKRVTLGVIALLVVVFLFELAVRATYSPRVWQYMFLANLSPSPGWVLAPFSHRGIAHLVTTVPVIAVYGGLVEQHLPPAAYLAFYVLAGYVSTVAQLLEYAAGLDGLGTLGASGAALGLVTLFVTTTLAKSLDGSTDVPVVERAFAVTGVVSVGIVLVNDFVPGIVFTAGTAPLGHAGGMAAGVAFGLAWRAQGQSTRPP